MAFCTECGTPLPGDAVFCPNCGTPLHKSKGENHGEEGAGCENNQGYDPHNQSRQNNSGSRDTYYAPTRNSDDGWGYPSRPSDPVRKSGGNKIAIIAIATLSVVLIFVAILFFNISDGNMGGGSSNPPTDNNGVGQNGAPSAKQQIAGSGYVGSGKFFVSVIGAEEFTDYNGESAMRIYYEFTNNFDYAISAWDALGFNVTQDGKELEETYSWNQDETAYYAECNIRPGITIQSCYQFVYNPNGGNVDFAVYDYSDGFESAKVTATYSPGNLPGRPVPYQIAPIAEPHWTRGVPSEGYLDEYFYVKVTDAEIIEDLNGRPAIRVYYEFTNNGDEVKSLSSSLYYYAYQDGISLDITAAPVDSQTDMNFYNDVNKGQTVTASAVFLLRNQQSAVEAELEATFTYDAVGQTYVIG